MRFFRGSVIPVWVGMVVAGLAITVIEFLGSKIYPPPLGMNPEDPASVRAAMALRGCLGSHFGANRPSISRIMANLIIASLVSVKTS